MWMQLETADGEIHEFRITPGDLRAVERRFDCRLRDVAADASVDDALRLAYVIALRRGIITEPAAGEDPMAHYETWSEGVLDAQQIDRPLAPPTGTSAPSPPSSG